MAASRGKKSSGGKRTSKRQAQKGKSQPENVGTIDELQAAGDESRSQWMLASKTKESYEGYVRRGKEWLAKIVEASQSSDLVEEDGEGNPVDLTMFALSFEKPPNRYSARALHLYLIEKCVRQGFGVNTCDSIYSAFKKMWENM